MSFAIRTRDLTKKFRGKAAVDGLSLEVPEESIYALVGPNGAGKTTTIKTLLNIIRPTSGTAEVMGCDSLHLGPDDFARLGYVSENQEMPDWMTVGRLLDYLRPFYPEWDGELEAELISQLQLPRTARIRDLSRGMRIKAQLASSLAYRPKLIVLDEPFGGLDAVVRDQVIETLLDRAPGRTILISSHDLAEIETFASHVGYLENGKLKFSEEMTPLTARFREVEVVLDAPPSLPRPWPADWLRPEASSAVVRFVDSQYDDERTSREISRLFPGARNVTVEPMPLRAIFVALARSVEAA